MLSHRKLSFQVQFVILPFVISVNVETAESNNENKDSSFFFLQISTHKIFHSALEKYVKFKHLFFENVHFFHIMHTCAFVDSWKFFHLLYMPPSCWAPRNNFKVRKKFGESFFNDFKGKLNSATLI